MRIILQVLSLVLLLTPQLVMSDVYRYEAFGVVDFISEGGTPVDGQFMAGDTFRMRFVLDTEEEFVPDGSSDSQSMYRQSYPINITFNEGSGPVLSTIHVEDPPWFGAEQHRTVVEGLRQHESGNNSEGMHFYLDGEILTIDWIDLVFGFREFSAPFAFVDTILMPLPEFSEFDQARLDLNFVNWGESPLSTIVSGYFESLTQVPITTCSGFYAPMDSHPVRVKKNRVLPLKIELFDAFGSELTDSDLLKAPVVEITRSSNNSLEPVDVSDDALAAGLGTDGNEFEYTDYGYWQFNLKTSSYSAAGTYTVKVLSGDEWSYTLGSECSTSFTIR